MKAYKDIKSVLQFLKEQHIKTWFDLGLFLDRLKEENEQEEFPLSSGYEAYLSSIGEGGVAFLTFHYMVDGVTVEVGKYASLFERIVPGIPVHYIGGVFRNKSETLIQKRYHKKQIPELKGFGEWDLYEDFFMTELERGSEAYNRLITEFWKQTLRLVEKLGSYILDQDIRLLYSVNFNSNPGNVSAALALVLLSELLGIPVINNSHDFYFEGGASVFDRKSKKLRSGPRDFFFTNAHLGEVFSIIELLFPWESKQWLNVVINSTQSDYLIRYKGHHPSRVMDLGTAVDTSVYTRIDKRRNINSFLQFEKMMARYKKQLISYSVEDVLNGELVSEKESRPVLIGYKTAPVKKFISENIIFLQPTRIISRKRIELGFTLLLRMFENEVMKSRMLNTTNLKITLLITGPIASGHYSYYKRLLLKFSEMLEAFPEGMRSKIYLALMLGELDREVFQKRFEKPIGIPELYNIASLILLPSETEGRGLPIIEATACGTPIFCRRYAPEEVYSEVIGEHLEEKDRLKVYEFSGKKISGRLVNAIVDRVFFPHNYTGDTKHNKRVVERRYSLNALSNNIQEILKRLHGQLLNAGTMKHFSFKVLEEYKQLLSFRNEDFDALVNCEKRQYLPGYGSLSFMLMLKSLIDPSYFRIEQQLLRGMVFHFSREILRNDPDSAYIPEEKILEFYEAVDAVFKIRAGEVAIRHDHSMSYRHRNRNYYPYQDFTFQELTGLVNLLYLKIVQPFPQVKVDLSTQFFTDWNLALLQLTGSNYLAIDNREKLIKRLQANVPIAYFPGEHIMYELEFFALQAIRSRLKLPIEVEVSRELLEREAGKIAAVYIFAQEHKLGKQLSKDDIENYIVQGMSEELKLLREFRLIKLVRTEQLSVGIHFCQLGEEPLRLIRKIRDAGGFLLSNRRHAVMMTDIVMIDRFHIGKVRPGFSENILGIPVGSGYVQYVPAGFRTTIAYPTPIQTAKDFDEAFRSDLYKEMLERLGEEAVMAYLLEDAELRGAPVMHSLEQLKRKGEKADAAVHYEYVSGVYEDGKPYSGAFAKIDTKGRRWNFKALNTDKPKTVLAFVKGFEKESGCMPEIAWNGGYILNAELVGKLGLPESYIGSPLGMLISEGYCMSAPLFNKAALLISSSGEVKIEKVNCSKGIRLEAGSWKLEFGEEHYNKVGRNLDRGYFDLMYGRKEVLADGKTVIRFSGNTVMEVISTKPGEKVAVIPVGLTVLLNRDMVPDDLKEFRGEGIDVVFRIKGYEDIEHAIEAGPMLVEDGQLAIDMESEGWKTDWSIATQAARLDYTDMRGPKIAVGINEQGELAVLTINGRIRESVGATHVDMAEVLMKYGMVRAMGFDPGGSSTLVVGGKTLNISPYNKKYEYGVYAMDPEPRAVSNAVLGFRNQELGAGD
jgi:glycosyltransferase involved in cell wall biosynthesis